MSEHEWAGAYESAVAKFEQHLRRNSDGTFTLNAENGPSIGIEDAVVFADLNRSLQVTNEQIRRGEVKSEQITSLSSQLIE